MLQAMEYRRRRGYLKIVYVEILPHIYKTNPSWQDEDEDNTMKIVNIEICWIYELSPLLSTSISNYPKCI